MNWKNVRARKNALMIKIVMKMVNPMVTNLCEEEDLRMTPDKRVNMSSFLPEYILIKNVKSMIL